MIKSDKQNRLSYVNTVCVFIAAGSITDFSVKRFKTTLQ